MFFLFPQKHRDLQSPSESYQKKKKIQIKDRPCVCVCGLLRCRSSITRDSHYAYCSHHSLCSPSSIARRAGRALNGALCSTSRRLAGKGADKQIPQRWNCKKIHKLGAVDFTGAFNGELSGEFHLFFFFFFFSSALGVLLLEAPRCKHVTSPVVMALTNCLTYCSDKRQS